VDPAYVHVHVGRDHPMADSRGYCAEHRLVMARLVGRMLAPGEVVHHVDGVKRNNDPSNLWLFADGGSHRSWHEMSARGWSLHVTMPAVLTAHGAEVRSFTGTLFNAPSRWWHAA